MLLGSRILSASPPYCLRSLTLTRTMSSTQSPLYPSFSTSNFYAGSRLNRLSWLRTDDAFLNRVLSSPSSRFLPLDNLNPLVHSKGEREGKLATLGWDDVKSTILMAAGASGDKKAVFGIEALGITQKQEVDDASGKVHKMVEGMGPPNIVLVFLGIDETDQSNRSLPGDLAKRTSADTSSPHESPAYWALSLTHRRAGHNDDEVLPTDELRKKLLDGDDYEFVDTRTLAATGSWEASDAALVAQARSLVDWNERNQYCPACSRRQYSIWGGYKRGCSSALTASFTGPHHLTPYTSDDHPSTKPCPSTTQLSNFSYPRTDPVIIMGVISSDGESILLGRQKKWPKGFYSCLAGFVEPGESLEEAVAREIMEESGVDVGDVVYHSSQPWPFPANLMIGALAIAKSPNPQIRLDLDNELESARFFSREEVLAVLGPSASGVFSKADLDRVEGRVSDLQGEGKGGADGQRWNEKDEGSVANVKSDKKGSGASFKLPGQTAIAHVLVASWARGEALLPSGVGAERESVGGKGRM